MAFFPHIQPPRPEVRAFLEDIGEHPDDDTSRLVLADWLDDNGDEADRARAEFIRLQCLLARPGVAPPGSRRRQLELLEGYIDDWLGPLAKLVDGWRFERGLLHLALLGIQCFARELQQLILTETFAWVEGLTLRQVTGAFINVAEQLPLLSHVQTLTIEDSRPGDAALCRLVVLPAITGLRELNLCGCQVSANVIRELATSSNLQRLQALDLTRNYTGAMGPLALREGNALPCLQRLHLGYNQVPDDALDALAESPLLRQLHWLDLRGNQCGGEGLQTLVRSTNSAGLRGLVLTGVPLRAGTMRALGSSPTLTSLRQLYLDRTGVGNEALKVVAFSQGLARLEHLSLGRNNLTDEGVVALANSTSPVRPRVLELAHNHIDREGAIALATSPVFAGVEELGLEDNCIGDEGALALAASPVLGRLHYLDAGNNGLGPVGQALLLRRFGRRVVLV